MTDIYEINLKTGISIKKLRSMDRQGFLKTSKPENPEAARMQSVLRKGNRLSTMDLLRLINEPDLVAWLGPYDYIADQQIASLGDVRADAAPSSFQTIIEESYRGGESAIMTLEQWVKDVIPMAGEVSHHFISVRALMSFPKSCYRLGHGWLCPSLVKIRARPSFAGWFTLRPTPDRGNITFYHRPRNNYDL